MYDNLKIQLQEKLEDIKFTGLYKHERIITSVQGAGITIAGGPKSH